MVLPSAKKDQDREILAYRDRVIAADRLAAQFPDASLEDLIAEALHWVHGYGSGTLVALPPILYEDHLADGVRGEILFSGLGLSSNLITTAECRLKSAPTALAQTGLLAAETAHGLRGFETQALIRVLAAQRRAVEVVATVARAMPAHERRKLRKRVLRLVTDESEVERMMREERRRIDEYRRRQRSEETDVSDSPQKSLNARRGLSTSNAVLRKLLKIL